MLGTVVAPLLISRMKRAIPAAPLNSDLNLTAALLVVFLYTSAPVYFVLNVANIKGTEGNSIYGLKFQITVLFGTIAIADISGGSLNPYGNPFS